MKDYKYIFEEKAKKKQARNEFIDAFSRIAQVVILLTVPTLYLYGNHNNTEDDNTITEPLDIPKSSIEVLQDNAKSITEKKPVSNFVAPVAEPVINLQKPQETKEASTDNKLEIQAQIVELSENSGINPEYLLLLAAIESSLNPDAKANNGSASGLFQFVEQTWLETIKKYGDKHGLGYEASLIKKGIKDNPNFFYVIDKKEEKRILDMRFDPKIATKMAIETTKEKQKLLDKIGVKATNVNLYMVHFLGKRGASRFLTILNKNPHWNPVDYFSRGAIQRNKGIFYFRDGKTPKSFGQIHKYFEQKIIKARKMLEPSLVPSQKQPDTNITKPKV